MRNINLRRIGVALLTATYIDLQEHRATGTAGRKSFLEQEAQLSQRGHPLLRVIEYFANSLKVTQGHSK